MPSINRHLGCLTCVDILSVAGNCSAQETAFNNFGTGHEGWLPVSFESLSVFRVDVTPTSATEASTWSTIKTLY